MFDAYELNKSAQYATADELDYIAHESQYIDPKRVVMLGAGPGVFALALYDNYRLLVPNVVRPTLTIIDKNTCDYARAHLHYLGIDEEFETVINDSSLAGLEWDISNKVGLIIIDADHSTEAVLRDIDAWFQHVAWGGLIFFHDYLERDGGFNGTGEWEKGSVAAAIEQRQYLPWQLEAEVGISVVYRKL